MKTKTYEEGTVKYEVRFSRTVVQYLVVPVWAAPDADRKEIAERATMAIDQDTEEFAPAFKWVTLTEGVPCMENTKINWKESPLYHTEEESE